PAHPAHVRLQLCPRRGAGGRHGGPGAGRSRRPPATGHRLHRRAAGRGQRRRRLRRDRAHAGHVQGWQEGGRQVSVQLLIQAAYFLVAVVFILGLKAMSSPVTARRGIVWAGYAMIGATVVTFAWPGMQNFGLMLAAIIIGGAAAWISGKKVAMTDMPQMVAIYNGMGGGAAAAIAALEFARGELGLASGS